MPDPTNFTPTNITPASGGSKNLPVALFIFVAFLLGALLSYGYFSFSTAGKATVTPVLPTPKPVSLLATTFEDIAEKQRKIWAELVSKISVDFTLKGLVVDIQPATNGKNITLKNGQAQSVVFVWNSATVSEGQVGKFATWKAITLDKLQPGDKLTIRSNIDLAGEKQNTAFQAWWVLREI